mgnify:CR=1 FL=1
MSSDRMGTKHFVKFGLYIVKGAINVQLAEKTGFTEEDAEVVKKQSQRCLLTMLLLQDQKALWKLLNYTGLNITVRTGSILLHRFTAALKYA